MKNYYDQKQELEVAKTRLKTLKEKRQLYFNETQPKSKKINGVMVKSTPTHTDKFLEYTTKVEVIDDEIEMLEHEIRILSSYLRRMENSLRSMKGILEKVFVDKYVDNMAVTEIALKNNYSQVQIYRYLKKINKIIKDDKKW